MPSKNKHGSQQQGQQSQQGQFDQPNQSGHDATKHGEERTRQNPDATVDQVIESKEGDMDNRVESQPQSRGNNHRGASANEENPRQPGGSTANPGTNPTGGAAHRTASNILGASHESTKTKESIGQTALAILGGIINNTKATFLSGIDAFQNVTFSKDPAYISQRFFRAPSRLWTAIEVAAIIFILAVSSWFLLYLSLGLVAFELLRRLYFAARVESSIDGKAVAPRTQMVGPYSNPRNIFISGASSGIGEQLALFYAKNGAHTLYLIARSRDKLEAVARACKQLGGSRITVQTMAVDVNNRKLMHSTILDANTRTPLDLVIANAGVGISTVDQNASWEDQVRSMTSTNIEGVLNTIMPIIPVFKQRRGGQIAVISSIAGICSLPGAYPYGATKAYLNALGQGLRTDLAQYGVSYVNICPGFVRSRLTEERHKRLRFGLPFFLEGDEGARRIAMAIADDVPNFAFPAPMHAISWFARTIPAPLMDALYVVGRHLGLNVSSIH